MKIKTIYKDNVNVVVLILNGELDMATVDSLLEKAEKEKKEYKKIIFDFSGINFVDSTGIGKLIKFFQDNDDLKYAISNLQDEVAEIFDILNLAEILGFDIFVESNEEALSFLQKKN